MAEQVKRAYAVKDVEMFIAIATIIDNALASQEFLATKRSKWTSAYFKDIRSRIDGLIESHFGADNAQSLRNATATVMALQNAALANLSELKVQIAEDFKKQPARRDELLTLLGFRDFQRDAALGDQEALISLLYRYKSGLTDSLRAELLDKDISATTPDNILNYAHTLKEADVLQEGKKGDRPQLTAEMITRFNDIYQEVISIANISKRFYNGNPAKAAQFSFGKITKGLNQNRWPAPAA